MCQNEGVCTLDSSRAGGYICQCSAEFKGRNCELNSLCEDSGGCQNGLFASTSLFMGLGGLIMLFVIASRLFDRKVTYLVLCACFPPR